MIKKKFDNKGSGDHINLDRYLITYADLITLLLGLFVILYATSQVNEEKYKEFSNAFTDFFKPDKESKASNGNKVLTGPKNSIPEPIFPYPLKKNIETIKVETEMAMKDYIKKGLFEIKSIKNGLTLMLPEKLLFQSGKAEIQPEGMKVIDSLMIIMRNLNKTVTIDGHTDSQPIRTFRYESNWHLSVARALNIGYSMISKGLPEKNVVIRGFGAQKPIAENSDLNGRARNRRVEIVITDLPEEIQAMETAVQTTTKEKQKNK